MEKPRRNDDDPPKPHLCPQCRERECVTDLCGVCQGRNGIALATHESLDVITARIERRLKHAQEILDEMKRRNQ